MSISIYELNVYCRNLFALPENMEFGGFQPSGTSTDVVGQVFAFNDRGRVFASEQVFIHGYESLRNGDPKVLFDYAKQMVQTAADKLKARIEGEEEKEMSGFGSTGLSNFGGLVSQLSSTLVQNQQQDQYEQAQAYYQQQLQNAYNNQLGQIQNGFGQSPLSQQATAFQNIWDQLAPAAPAPAPKPPSSPAIEFPSRRKIILQDA